MKRISVRPAFNRAKSFGFLDPQLFLNPIFKLAAEWFYPQFQGPTFFGSNMLPFLPSFFAFL